MPVLRPGAGSQIGGPTTLVRTTAPAAKPASGSSRVYDWPAASSGVTYTAPDATGGSQTAGAADVSKAKAPQIAGGAQSAGSAVLSKARAAQLAGGAQAAGSATLCKIKAAQLAGGAQAAGSAGVATARAAYGTGGAVSGGNAELADIDVPEVVGGGQSGGSATSAFVAAGDAVVYLVDGTGGAIAGGAAVCSSERPPAATAPTGGCPVHLLHLPLVPAHAAEDPVQHVYIGTGGVHAAGTAQTSFHAAAAPPAAIARAPGAVDAHPAAIPEPEHQVRIDMPAVTPIAPPPRPAAPAAVAPPPVTRDVHGAGGAEVRGAAGVGHHESMLGLDEEELFVLLDALTA